MSLTSYLVFAWLIVNSAFVTSQSIPPNYFLGTELVTRDQAVERCEEKDMNLVTIENEEKNNAIGEFLQKNGATEAYWTSAIKQVGSDWFWLDGRKLKYFSWGEGEPNGARRVVSCIEVFQTPNGTVWNDQPCRDKRGYICEPKYPDQTSVTMNKAIQKCLDKCMGAEKNEKIDWDTKKAQFTTEYPLGVMNAACQKKCMPTKKFYLNQARVPFDEAPEICKDQQLKLASLLNKDENTALYNLVIGKGRDDDIFWVSGKRAYLTSAWKWGNDGDPMRWADGKPIKYSNWREGEPNGNANIAGWCLEVEVGNKELEWNDQNCNDERYVVCEETI